MFAFFAWWCLQYNLVLFGKCETVLCWISKLAKPWTLNSALKNVVYFRHCIYRYIETRTRDAVNTNIFVSGAELSLYSQDVYNIAQWSYLSSGYFTVQRCRIRTRELVGAPPQFGYQPSELHPPSPHPSDPLPYILSFN